MPGRRRNRTKVGLKAAEDTAEALEAEGRNRTKVGLKVAGDADGEGAGRAAIEPRWD